MLHDIHCIPGRLFSVTQPFYLHCVNISCTLWLIAFRHIMLLCLDLLNRFSEGLTGKTVIVFCFVFLVIFVHVCEKTNYKPNQYLKCIKAETAWVYNAKLTQRAGDTLEKFWWSSMLVNQSTEWQLLGLIDLVWTSDIVVRGHRFSEVAYFYLLD